MKIGKKLTMGFLVVVVLMAILGSVNIVSIKNIGNKTKTHHTLHLPIMTAITHMRIDIEEIIRATEEYDADWMTKEKSSEEIKEKKDDVETHLERLFAARGLLTLEEVESLKGSVNELYDLSAKLFRLHGKTRAKRAPIMEEFDEKVAEIDGKLDVLLKKVDEASKASMDSIVSTVTSSGIIFISVLAVVILAALGTAFAISRSISNPITKLRNAAVEIGKGDLSKRAEVKSKDEIGELATSFNQMTEEIQKRNEELQTMNEELRSTNEELETSNEELQATTEELEASNEELRATQEELIQKEKLAAVGQLASGVGHELRNPLGVIKNAVYYIKSKIGTEDTKLTKHLDIMEKEIANSSKIISDLLGFSMTRKPELIPAEVNEVIEEAISVANIPENVKVTRNLISGLPKPPIDKDQIRQVFLNIMINAYQAMPQGGELKISSRLNRAGLKVEGKEKDCIEIEFTDTGTGIAPEDIKKLFDPFFTTKAKGIGLGLAVTKGIIESHQGDIEVKSELNKGTSFIIKLGI